MLETSKRKKTQTTQSRPNVRNTKTQKLSSQAIKIRCLKSKHKQSQAKNLQPYNLKNRTSVFTSVFVCKSMQRIKGGGVSKQAIWFVFFSKLKMWNLKTRDGTVVEV
jgi:hypothetical protein